MGGSASMADEAGDMKAAGAITSVAGEGRKRRESGLSVKANVIADMSLSKKEDTRVVK
jgi:hypothetical protein